MKRINVTFYDEIFEKLEQRTQERKSTSIAQSIRELVDLGFKIEETAKKNVGENQELDGLNAVINLLKNNIKWVLETLLLTRQVVGQLDHSEGVDPDDVVSQCKEQARNHIKKMFPEESEIEN